MRRSPAATDTKGAPTMDFFERLETVRDRWNVLDHPFYERWSAGELSRAELSFYAAEYRSAVVALADASESAADAAAASLREGLQRHAVEERAHVRLWDRFAEAVDADLGREPLPETIACASAWTAAADLLEGLAVLYAVESGQPGIARTKRHGLAAHYGIGADDPATEYFTLHEELDHRHATESRAMIDELAEEGDEDRLLAVAQGALQGNWKLLDGVERSFRAR
jgi:pyrroloquinoline-quinone synthase